MLRVLFLIPILVAPALLAQEPASRKVPLLREVPLLSQLFQEAGKTTIPLSEEAVASIPTGAESLADLPFGLRHPLNGLRRRFPNIKEVRVIDRTLRRIEATTSDAQRHVAVELEGSGDLGPARDWLVRSLPGSGAQVMIETVMVWRPGVGKEEVQVRFLHDAEAKGLLDEAKHGEFSVISSPKVLVTSGQRANVSVLNQTSYVKDFDVEVSMGGVTANPIVDVIQDGIVLDFTPVLDPATGEVALAAQLTLSTLERPIPTVEAKILNDAAPVQIQLPTLLTTRWDSEDLLFSAAQPWCRVSGLTAFAPKEGEEGSTPGRLDVWMRTRVLTEESLTASGLVVGVDREAGLVFVKWDAPSAAQLAPGDRARVDRVDRIMGALEAVGEPGRIQTFKLLKGEAKAGDRVRPNR